MKTNEQSSKMSQQLKTKQKITKNHQKSPKITKKSPKNHQKSLKNHQKSPKTSPKIINNHQQYPPTNWHDQNHQKLSNICQICKKPQKITKNHQKITKNHQKSSTTPTNQLMCTTNMIISHYMHQLWGLQRWKVFNSILLSNWEIFISPGNSSGVAPLGGARHVRYKLIYPIWQ